MSSVECLREFVNERLTAAAEEIFRVFKQAIVEYEEEIDRQRKLLGVIRKHEIKLHRIELPQQHVCKEEEVLAEQQLLNQERNSSLDQEDPEPPQIKEEQEELCTSQEGEPLELKLETDAFMLTPAGEERDHSEPELKSHHQQLSDNSHVAESQLCRSGTAMAETMKLSGNHVTESGEMSSYRDCMRVILKLLADFGRELKLSDAALRIEVNVDAVDLQSPPGAHAYNCLQKHITKLQAVSESLNTLVVADSDTSSSKDNTSDEAVSSLSLKEQVTALPEHDLPSSDDADGKVAADDIMVQIRARKSEIERRISAFMERKQMEINENNVREFCNVIDCNQENSCARTDAVFTPYPGFKSHVKVTRVVNTYGPQTRGGGGQGEAGEHQRGQMGRDCGNAAIEERLHNIETHLKLPTAGPVPLSVYQRLKRLEDRILELEGLSPEYFQSTSHLHKRPKTSPAQACSLTELDEKISAVKAALLKRVNEFGPGYGAECPM